MSILEQRGVFWWYDEAIADGLLAPDAHVAGTLRVEDNGRALLELDGCLPNPHGPMAAMTRDPVGRCIQGLLKSGAERVLLCDLFRNGGSFSTYGISFERFSAAHCLIGLDIFPSDISAPTVNDFTVALDGYEEWLRLGKIDIEDASEAITATYRRLDDVIYPNDCGTLSLIFDIDVDRKGMLGIHAYSVKQKAYAKLSLNAPGSLSHIALQFGMLEDLLKILTGSDYELPWPTLTLSTGSHTRWYFQRIKNKKAVEAPSHYNAVTSFPELRDTFGAVWSRWKTMREEFGPGVYLYLGTRRGVAMYVENRFVNLLWGLEALHRKKGSGDSDAIVAKVHRVLDKIDDPKDKRWLAEILKRAHEPRLEQRLFELFKVLPLGLDEERLRAFCQACAKRRNDMSHFGGERHYTSYSEFLKDLNDKAEALSVLYQAVLLNEIGIDAGILKRWVFESFGSFPIKVHFVAAGLDPGVLKAGEQPDATPPGRDVSAEAGSDAVSQPG